MICCLSFSAASDSNFLIFSSNAISSFFCSEVLLRNHVSKISEYCCASASESQRFIADSKVLFHIFTGQYVPLMRSDAWSFVSQVLLSSCHNSQMEVRRSSLTGQLFDVLIYEVLEIIE